MSIDQRLRSLGIELPRLSSPAGLYAQAVRTGPLLYLSGKGPTRADGSSVEGRVGSDLTLQEGRDAARLAGLQLLAAIAAEPGGLDAVVKVVKTLGMVNCAPGFTETPAVIDGCSELLIQVFGEAGRGARSAVGLAELPFGIAVEIELIVELRD